MFLSFPETNRATTSATRVAAQVQKRGRIIKRFLARRKDSWGWIRDKAKASGHPGAGYFGQPVSAVLVARQIPVIQQSEAGFTLHQDRALLIEVRLVRFKGPAAVIEERFPVQMQYQRRVRERHEHALR